MYICITCAYFTAQKLRTAVHKAVSYHFLTVKYLVEEIELNPTLPDAVSNYYVYKKSNLV